MASLLMLKGPNPGHRFELSQDKVVLGRNPECDIVISGPAVSREHAQILRMQSQFFVKDLESRNKTKLNDQEIEANIPVRLQDNDQIQICDFLFSFHERTPLPPAFQPEEEEEEPVDGASSTVMSTVEAGSSHLVLQAQPAERLKVIIEITNSMAGTLELDPLLPKVIDQLFQIFRQADRGFIVVRDEATGRLLPKALKTRRERDEPNARFSRRIVNQCIDLGQAFLSEDALTDERFRMSQSISDFRIRSVMCAPLRSASGVVFGVIQLDTQDRTKRFTHDDLNLLVAISNQAAIAMDNARLHEEKLARERLEHEKQVAGEVQHVLLPRRLPSLPGYEFFAHYQSASHVGGDFYTFVELPNGRLAIAIGDVSGKGVPAALLMARLTAEVRSYMQAVPDPAQAVTHLNESLIQAGLGDRFVTFAVTVLDPQGHALSVVNAGHPAPLIRRAASNDLEKVAAGDELGLPLGVAPGHEYRACQVPLLPGDCVTLITDGILDAMNPMEEAFGTDRLIQVVSTSLLGAADLGTQLLKAVELHAAGQPQHDDITVVSFARR